MTDHWRREDGKLVCDCPYDGKCWQCDKPCNDHDIVGNGDPLVDYWCSECIDSRWDKYMEGKKMTSEEIESSLNKLAAVIHEDNKKWWQDLETGEPIQRNVGQLLMLAVSELAEAMEGDRKGLMDDHLPHRKMFEVELADCVIRILDTAHGLGYNLGEALAEKMEYNRQRADHKTENRKLEGGKKY